MCHRIVAIAVLLAPSPLIAGPLKAHPNRIPFGRVTVNAVAEASVLVLADGTETAGLSVKVEPPPFVRIDRIRIDQRDFGPDYRKVGCSFEVLLDTRKTGELKGDILVEFAGGKQTIPVTATVDEAVKGHTRVLILSPPFHMDSTDDAAVFQTWLELVKDAHLDVQYWLTRRDGPILRGSSLEDFDVVLLSDSGLFHVQDEDRKRLRRFVELGGRLIVGANYFYRGSVDRANSLVGIYGMKMHDEEPKSAGVVIVPKERVIADALTKDITLLDFHRPSPIQITDAKKAKLLTRFDDDLGIIAVARTDPGEVVLLGTSLWWFWITRNPKSDNVKQLRNFLTKPAK